MAEDGFVRARVGIQVVSEGRTFRAGPNETLRAGDFVRIYVFPDTVSHVYILHTDGGQTSILYHEELGIGSKPVILPSSKTYYRIDGNSSLEHFSIIVSPWDVEELQGADRNPMSYDRLVAVEKQLTNKDSLDLSIKPREKILLAGNVRGLKTDSETVDPFLIDSPKYTGKGILVKPYEFTIQK
jgi:hypothetical protein